MMDEITALFAQALQKRLGASLKQLILFGSRARKDDQPDSDYDLLVIVDEVSPAVKEAIDEIAGEVLYQHGAVFSAFPFSEKVYKENVHNPFLMNIRREGVVL